MITLVLFIIMMSCNTCKGLCLDRTNTNKEVQNVTVLVIAWTLVEGGPFHWSAYNVLESMLEYTMESANTTPCKRLKDLQALIGKLAASLGKPVQTQYFRGPQSYAVSNSTPPQNVDSSASFATGLLWALMCDGVLHRRPSSLRADIDLRGVMFAEATITPDKALHLVDHMHTPWSHNDAAMCSFDQDHAGHCAHIRHIVGAMSAKF